MDCLVRMQWCRSLLCSVIAGFPGWFISMWWWCSLSNSIMTSPNEQHCHIQFTSCRRLSFWNTALSWVIQYPDQESCMQGQTTDSKRSSADKLCHNNIDIEANLSLSEVWKPCVCCLKDRKQIIAKDGLVSSSLINTSSHFPLTVVLRRTICFHSCFSHVVFVVHVSHHLWTPKKRFVFSHFPMFLRIWVVSQVLPNWPCGMLTGYTASDCWVDLLWINVESVTVREWCDFV